MFNNKAKRHHLRNTNLCRVGVSPSTGIIPQKNYEKQEKIQDNCRNQEDDHEGKSDWLLCVGCRNRRNRVSSEKVGVFHGEEKKSGVQPRSG